MKISIVPPELPRPIKLELTDYELQVVLECILLKKQLHWSPTVSVLSTQIEEFLKGVKK